MADDLPEGRGTASGANKVAALIILLAAVGVGLSVELTVIHYNTHTNPDFSSICAISEGVNCESVALSSYSVFLHLPVSVWGLVGYLAVICVAGFAIGLRKSGSSSLLGVLAILAYFCAGASLVLGTISFTKIDSLCLFCMGTYLVNGVMAGLAALMVRRTGSGFFTLLKADIGTFPRRPLLTLALVASCAVPLVAATFAVNPYWESEGWGEIPILKSNGGGDGPTWIGAEDPLVTVVEFTDYECPYCRTAHRKIRKMITDRSDRVRLVHRHFPLDKRCNPKVKREFHRFACEFSMAVECAGAQGKFWEMNDAIFSSQDNLKSSEVNVHEFALRIGLDRGDFERCMAQKTPSGKIAEDIELGVKLGVSATPTFIVNGKIFKGGLTEDQLDGFLTGKAY